MAKITEYNKKEIDQVKKSLKFDMAVQANRLVIAIGYRKSIAKSYLESSGKERAKQLERFKEVNNEIKKILVL